MKKILIGVLILVGVLAAVILWFRFDYTLRASPEAKVSYVSKDLQIEIVYCRPSVKERVIFGPENSGALLPYGVYWRLGANKATEITFLSDVQIAGEKIVAGTYRLYAIPFEDHWDVRLNKEIDVWGYGPADEANDILAVDVPTTKAEKAEMLTISIVENNNSALIIMQWDDVKIELPVMPG